MNKALKESIILKIKLKRAQNFNSQMKIQQFQMGTTNQQINLVRLNKFYS